jgi:curli biogenesis system outer membrane secretion channel CsgG
MTRDPTSKYHKEIQTTLQQCDKIINKKQIKFLIQKNPSPPTLNALLKLHKPAIPVRPVINNTNSQAHKAAKKLNTILNSHLHLSNQYNTINSSNLADTLTKLHISHHHRLLNLDIKDLRVNIPTQEALILNQS